MIQIEASLVKSEKPLDLSNELLMNYHSDLIGNIFPYLNHFIEVNDFTGNIVFFLRCIHVSGIVQFNTEKEGQQRIL